MRRRPPPLLVVPIALAVSGCLPARDNPLDPSRRPIAELLVVDTQMNAPCSDTVPDADYPQIFLATRGRCLALDARGSSDPNRDDLSFTFSWSSDESGPQTDLAVSTSSALFALDSDFLRGRPLGGDPTWFHVRVEDGTGSHATATTNLLLENGSPTTIVPPPRTLRRGGLPWAPAESMNVEFFGTAADPDQDDISEWCWTFPDTGEICSEDQFDPAFVRTLSATNYTTYRATLRVRDGDAYSEPASTWVRVEDNGWALDTTGRLYSLPTLPAVKPDEATAGTVNVALYRPPAGSRAQPFLGISTYYDPPTGGLSNVVQEVYLASWPQASRIGARFTVPQNRSYELAFDPDGDFLWVSDGTQVRTYAVSTASGLSDTGPGVLDWTEVPTIGLDSFGGQFLEVDDAGNAWIAERTGSSVTTVTPAGAQSVAQLGSGRRVGAIERRPDVGGIWVLDTFDESGASYGSRLLAFGDAATPPVAFEVSDASAAGMAWIDASFFWMSVSDRGVLLVDADALTSGASFDEAVAFEVPDAPFPYMLEADPGSGDCWTTSGSAYSGSEETARITLDGEVDRVEVDTFSGRFVDPAGSFWLAGANANASIRRIDGILPSGAREESAIPPTNEADIDLRSGNVWLSAASVGGVQELAPDGTLLRSIATISLEGDERGEVSVPLHARFRLQPGSDVAYAIHGSSSAGSQIDRQHGLYRYDLSTTPVTATLVLTSAELAYYSSYESFYTSAAAGYDEAVPALLAPTPQGHVWVQKATANDPFTQNTGWFVALAPDGSEQASFEIPLTEGPGSDPTSFFGPFREFEFRAAPSMKDGRLCTATLDQATSPATLKVRWISPIQGEPVQTLASFQVPGESATQRETTVGGVAVSRYDDNEEICWVALWAPDVNTFGCPWDTPGTLYGFTWNYGTVRAVTVPLANDIRSIVASSRDQVWISGRDCSLPNEQRLIEASYSAGFWTTVRHEPTTHVLFPLSPEASRPASYAE